MVPCVYFVRSIILKAKAVSLPDTKLGREEKSINLAII